MTKVKKFINDPLNLNEEVAEGFISANGGLLHGLSDNKKVFVADDLPEGRVGILIGGGSINFGGLIGSNMADCAACGNTNAAPNPYSILAGIRAIDRGKGVLFIYNNYAGDVLCFDMAKELAAEEGIQVKNILAWDSMGAESPEKYNERCGIAGIILLIKIAGSAASEICDLEELFRITSLARDNLRSIIVVGRSFSSFEDGELIFDLPDDEIIIGGGSHGQPGIIQCKMMPVDDIVDFILDKILADMPCKSRDEVAIFVNSMGATSLEELFIVNNSINNVLLKRSINVHHTDIGYYFPFWDMVGFSVSVMRLNDELKRYLDLPANSYFYKR